MHHITTAKLLVHINVMVEEMIWQNYGMFFSLTKTISGLCAGILVEKYGVLMNATLGEIFEDTGEHSGAFHQIDATHQNVTVDYIKSVTLYEIVTFTSGNNNDECTLCAPGK